MYFICISYKDNDYFKECLAFVYVGLKDEEALRLASRHNQNGHFNHDMTFQDYVSGILVLVIQIYHKI